MDILDNGIEFSIFTPGDWTPLESLHHYDFTRTLTMFKVVFHNLRT